MAAIASRRDAAPRTAARSAAVASPRSARHAMARPGASSCAKAIATRTTASTWPAASRSSAWSNAASSASPSPSSVRLGPVTPKRRANAPQGAFARHHGNSSGLASATLVRCASAQNWTEVAVPALSDTTIRPSRSRAAPRLEQHRDGVTDGLRRLAFEPRVERRGDKTSRPTHVATSRSNSAELRPPNAKALFITQRRRRASGAVVQAIPSARVGRLVTRGRRHRLRAQTQQAHCQFDRRGRAERVAERALAAADRWQRRRRTGRAARAPLPRRRRACRCRGR